MISENWLEVSYIPKEEIIQIIKKLKNNKSPDCYGTTGDLLKLGKVQLLDRMYGLFNKILKTEKISQWARAKNIAYLQNIYTNLNRIYTKLEKNNSVDQT